MPVPPPFPPIARPSVRQPASDAQPPGAPGPAVVNARVEAFDEPPLLRCARCQHPVTTENWRITVSGVHRHVFANPSGFVFEIGCFSDAPGCAAVGAPTPDFSWFPGTSWQVAVCTVCGLHLGWRYETTTGGFFYGLILNRLTSAGESPNA
ncbi:MAG: cereblon family protein [Solidesulfovibrio sp.]